MDLIRTENLQSGDRLPSAKALADRFSVATPTLREALRRLQTTGVITIKHGSGIYVRNAEERMVLANPIHQGGGSETILHLLEARLLVEPHLCELTTRGIGDANLAELERLLSEAEQYLEGNDEKLYELNMSFHRAIGRFSGNFVLAQVLESLIDLYSAEQLAILMLYNDRGRDYREHRGILEAIRSRDAARARDLMRRHIEGVKTTVERRLSEHDLSSGTTA
jgi:GntR family transcriptional repressor for pyruvate dehydrogenase complex